MTISMPPHFDKDYKFKFSSVTEKIPKISMLY